MHTELVLAEAGIRCPKTSGVRAKHFIPGHRALYLGVLLCLLQALDGVLTSIGISRFGIEFEGNPIIRLLMEQYGHFAVLSSIKLIAVMMVLGLTVCANRIPWISSAMGALSCAYVLMAIVPWTYILFIQPLI